MGADSLINTNIGRLYVKSLLSRNGYERVYLCSCSCGKEVTKTNYQLVNSRKAGTGSCGCLKRDILVKRNTTHGLCCTPEYKVWTSLINRCTNQKYVEYHLYGGRGITVDKDWVAFENFYRDMGPRPSPDFQIDRVNNELGYSKDNCRWVTKKENARNKRNTLIVTFNGESRSFAELAEKYEIDYHTAYSRYDRGWPIDRIFTTKLRGSR